MFLSPDSDLVKMEGGIDRLAGTNGRGIARSRLSPLGGDLRPRG